jgi:outer membrane protein assembly factor BamD (BamD/ComL family)
VKKFMLVMCIVLAMAGCSQKSSQEKTADAQRQEAAKKLFAQSIILLEQKDYKGAVTSLEASIKVDPADPNPYLVLGQILLKAGEYDRAVEFLDQTAKTFPDNGTVFYMLSVATKMDGKKLPSVLAARRSFEIFKAAGDMENAQKSSVLLEEVIAAAQEDEKNQPKKEATQKQ